MVDISDFFAPDDDEPEEPEAAGAEAEDLQALKDCLKALADAIASTNLAVINAAQADPAAATSRVQASVEALKRFHAAFSVLNTDGQETS